MRSAEERVVHGETPLNDTLLMEHGETMAKSQVQETAYRLADGVYYRLAGENVYVRNVTTRYDYLFNPMVKDILDILKEERTRDELLAALGKTYDIEHAEGFGDKIDRFLASMADKGVIDARRSRSELPMISDAEGTAKGFYQKNHKLWNACLELTYLCNERCRHCYLDDPKANQEIGILRFDVWRKVIDEIADMGCVNVLVTGGEPTLHPDFLQICRHITKRGMLLDIFTNALKISDSLFDAIVALKPNTVSFSLYGGTADFHDWVTQVPGSFEKSLRNILMFKCAGVDVFIKSVLFNGKADEFAKLRALAKRVGISAHCAQAVNIGRSGTTHPEFMADNETLTAYLASISDTEPLWQQKSPPVREPDSPVCGVGFSTLTFRPNGNVSPCIPYSYVLGNVKKDSVKGIWEGSGKLVELRNLKLRDVSPQCATCNDSGFCVICPGIALSEAGAIGPCSYSCRHARLKHSLFDSGVFRQGNGKE